MPPPTLRHSWIRVGIDLIKFWMMSSGTLARIRLIAAVRSGSVRGSSFASCLSSQDQRFSIGFKSGLLGGHCRVLIFLFLSQVATEIARWHGALSCCKMKLLGILSFFLVGMRFLLRMSMYKCWFRRPPKRLNRPNPYPLMQAQIPVDPLPTLVRSRMQSGWYFSDGSLRSIIRFLRLSTSMFISSKSNVRHFSTDHDLTSLQNFLRASLWALVSRGFLAAHFHSRPASSRRRRTVWALGDCSVDSFHCVARSDDDALRLQRLKRTSWRSSLALEILGRPLLGLFSNCPVALMRRITSETVETDREMRSAICFSEYPSLWSVAATIRSVFETSDCFTIASRFWGFLY